MFVKIVSTLVFNRYTLFLATVLLYIKLSPIIHMTKGVWRMEVPLLLYLYFCLNLLIKPSRWQAIVAALPLAALYLGHDYYYIRFARIPKWVELTQLPELIGVLDTGLALLLGLLVLLPIVGFILSMRFSLAGVVGLLPVLVVCSAPFVYPTEFINVFKKLTIEVIYYSTVVNVEYNGRFATALYNEAKRTETLQNLKNFRDMEQLSLRLPAELSRQANGRNVHLIVLESFIDPTLFDKVPKTVQPIHPDYLKLVGDKVGFSISPIFGGYTAQPEFEVLCGVPAFQEFDEIEFNIFTGSKTYCLPSILKNLGYTTTASNAYKPEFFNTVHAYQSLDFDAVYFAKEYVPGSDTYLSKGEEEEGNKFFFDEDLFTQNLGHVERLLAAKKPFLNYLLTVYGHFPFDLDSKAGPARFSVPGVPMAVEKIINQHYYRTKALARYIKELIALDPSALIILVSDHLPPLPGGIGEYDTLGYFQNVPDRLLINRLLVFRAGKIEKYDKFTHFNLYRLILDFVTDQAYCRAMPCNFTYPVDKEALRNDYHTIIGLATR
ncbi:MAG: LTA synthase family protein [Magnetococcales bacterium]|nr:LTA synthase family protein [Magnetococcales bacterium]